MALRWDEEAEVRCKFCGERDLWWAETKDGWRLLDGEGKQHTCRDMTTATGDEFD